MRAQLVPIGTADSITDIMEDLRSEMQTAHDISNAMSSTTFGTTEDGYYDGSPSPAAHAATEHELMEELNAMLREEDEPALNLPMQVGVKMSTGSTSTASASAGVVGGQHDDEGVLTEPAAETSEQPQAKESAVPMFA